MSAQGHECQLMAIKLMICFSQKPSFVIISRQLPKLNCDYPPERIFLCMSSVVDTQITKNTPKKILSPSILRSVSPVNIGVLSKSAAGVKQTK